MLKNTKMLNIQNVMLNNFAVKYINDLQIREYVINHEEVNMNTI